MRRSSPITDAFPEPTGAALEQIGRRVSASVQIAQHLANCATVSVQRTEQLMSSASLQDFNPYILQLFPQAKFKDVYPQFAHRRRKNRSLGTDVTALLPQLAHGK
jgi:hypothetical protein